MTGRCLPIIFALNFSLDKDYILFLFPSISPSGPFMVFLMNPTIDPASPVDSQEFSSCLVVTPPTGLSLRLAETVPRAPAFAGMVIQSIPSSSP